MIPNIRKALNPLGFEGHIDCFLSKDGETYHIGYTKIVIQRDDNGTYILYNPSNDSWETFQNSLVYERLIDIYAKLVGDIITMINPEQLVKNIQKVLTPFGYEGIVSFYTAGEKTIIKISGTDIKITLHKNYGFIEGYGDVNTSYGILYEIINQYADKISEKSRKIIMSTKMEKINND
jgi:hypothetical protein